MHVKDIRSTVSRIKAVSVGVGGFIGRHKRLSIAVGVALLLAGPLVTGDGELVFLNAVGLGFGAPLLRVRRRGRRAGLHPARRAPEPAGGHRAAGRQPRACAQGRQPSSRTAASQVRRACSAGPRPADGGGAFLRRSAPAQPRRLEVPGLAGRRPVRDSPPRPRLCAGQRAAGGS